MTNRAGLRPSCTTMPIHTADIALVFDEIADLLEIQGANVFRVRAYRNAARTLRDLGREMSAMVETYENLAALPGIGKDLAGKIQEIVQHGSEAILEEYRKGIPRGVTELMYLQYSQGWRLGRRSGGSSTSRSPITLSISASPRGSTSRGCWRIWGRSTS